MNKFDLKIGIFSNKFLNFKFETILKKAGFKNIYTFIDYSEELNEMDILLINEEFFNEEFNENTLIILLVNVLKENEDEIFLLIQKGVKNILLKSASSQNLLITIETLASFKLLEYKVLEYVKEIQTAITYKDSQEQRALNKQLKIIKDEISLKYKDHKIFNTYFKPKDVLSGDSYFTKIIGDKTFIVIVDSMGKGLSASTTAILSVSFISHLINTVEYSFDKIIKRFLEYIKSVLLNDEALCILFVEHSEEYITYANFGLPPIYSKIGNEVKKLKANNFPITIKTDFKDTKITKEKNIFDGCFMLTDGILETEVNGTIMLAYFMELVRKNYFLNELLKEIKKYVREFDDDVTIVSISKDKFNYKNIYEKEFYYNKHTIDTILEDIYSLNLPKKDEINFALIELLMNIYEHQDTINKDFLLKHGYHINHPDVYVKIVIDKSEEYIRFTLKTRSENDFDISSYIKKERLKKYSGRGIITVNHFVDALAYSKDGKDVKFFIRRKDGI